MLNIKILIDKFWISTINSGQDTVTVTRLTLLPLSMGKNKIKQWFFKQLTRGNLPYLISETEETM